MALRSVVFKAALSVADMDRHYYAEHPLVLALHPSETEERMMVRVLAFAYHADEGLTFGQGMSSAEEPDLWIRDFSGDIRLWIEVGLPEEKWVRKACARAESVVVYAYGRTADNWWQQNRGRLERLDNLRVYRLLPDDTVALGRLAQRSMQLQCNLQDGEMWLSNGDADVRIVREQICGPQN